MEIHGDDAPNPTIGRRRWSRQPAVEMDAYLCWDDGRRIALGSARLVNISRGGALLIAPRSFPEGGTVRFGLNRAVGGLDATVVQATRTGPEGYAVRLEFRDTCPESFFQAAVRSIGAGDPDDPADGTGWEPRLEAAPRPTAVQGVG